MRRLHVAIPQKCDCLKCLSVCERRDSRTLAGPGRDPNRPRTGPGRDPGATQGHRVAELRVYRGPLGAGLQPGPRPHARAAHWGVTRRSECTERCAEISQSGCSCARSLWFRVPAGSLPGPSRVPNGMKKKGFARTTRLFGASKCSSNDTEHQPVFPLYCAAAAWAPQASYLTRSSFFEGRKGILEGVEGGKGGGGNLVASRWHPPYL